MTNPKKIIFTGGSSGGHVAPNVPIIEAFSARGWDTHCVILGNDIERTLLGPTGATMHTIAVGKLRRYFDMQNITDMFRTAGSLVQAVRIVRSVRPQAIFSKGGNIGVPMAFAAWLCRVPFFVHEADTIPSLTTRLTAPIARIVFSGFPEDTTHPWKSIFGTRIHQHAVGIPLRAEFLHSSPPDKGDLGGFVDRKTLFVTGGGLGATPINTAVRAALPLLTKEFDIIHVCGKGKKDATIPDSPTYRQYEFVDSATMFELMNSADVVITRGSATTLQEILALKKPMLIIPLTRAASRGDQIENARFMQAHHLAEVIEEEKITPQNLYEAVTKLAHNQNTYKQAMAKHPTLDSVALIVKEIEESVRSK